MLAWLSVSSPGKRAIKRVCVCVCVRACVCVCVESRGTSTSIIAEELEQQPEDRKTVSMEQNLHSIVAQMENPTYDAVQCCGFLYCTMVWSKHSCTEL